MRLPRAYAASSRVHHPIGVNDQVESVCGVDAEDRKTLGLPRLVTGWTQFGGVRRGARPVRLIGVAVGRNGRHARPFS
jgi:hypothetical protein